MSEYTRGPWEWENGVLCSDKYIIGGNSHSFNASNKAMIAAAPDLLEALEGILSAQLLPEYHQKIAKAAIAKAKAKAKAKS
ncbi:hypothetical protein [Pectobacterium parmentieri]|uniref:hypothetical protein n=1 Tax=Pectobacterium parmentieri TaxID=1905730 RepID=UPI000D611CE2|nr:hypothetical protein [Pectobacterium parmentieri]PWD66548.1 hypothetical protein DF211_01995 [Pectobacterium parmentieri]